MTYTSGWKNSLQSRSPEELLCHERILTWDISSGEKVIVAGGYQGVVCAYMLERYPDIDLYTWEPQPHMYNTMVKRFKGVDNIHIYDYGLGEIDGVFPMTQGGNDACSFIIDPTKNKSNLLARMRDFVQVMDELQIERLALFHMNIESYEHILLPYLIRTKWIDRIDQLVVSTHGIQPNNPRVESWDWIMENLARTHNLYWIQRGFHSWYKTGRKAVYLPAVLNVPAEGVQTNEVH